MNSTAVRRCQFAGRDRAAAMARASLCGIGFLVAACQAIPPSSPESRLATPVTVTRENPAGDAEEPEDAALTRLLTEKTSERRDRNGTLALWLPDAGQWRRVKLFGHPTRVTHRYGDEHFALDSLAYGPAEGEDSAAACLQRFVDRARAEASRFGVAVGPIDHGQGQYSRGVEALNATTRRPVPATPPSTPPVPSADPAPSQPAPSQPAPSQPAPSQPAPLLLLTPVTSGPQPLSLSLVRPLPRSPRGSFGAALGLAPMPYVRGSGEFTALFTRQRYVGAVAAYRSWPGTCLVHAFAVRVGTDEGLAQKVVDRWLDEIAPRTRWLPRTRLAPPVEDR